MKKYLTISRKWNNPEIIIKVCDEEIDLRMSIADFKKALVEEMSPISTVITKKGLEKRINEAVDTIIKEVKSESSKVMK